MTIWPSSNEALAGGRVFGGGGTFPTDVMCRHQPVLLDRVSGAQSRLSWLGHHLRAGVPVPDMTALTEAASAVQLAVTIDERQPGRWVNGDTIGYIRTGKGNEIDVGPAAVPTAGGIARTTPLEAKWVTQGWRSKALVTEIGRRLVAGRGRAGGSTGPIDDDSYMSRVNGCAA